VSSPVSIKLSWVELWDEILFVWSTIYEISCIGLDDTVFWLDCFLYFSNDALYPVYTIQPVVKLVVKPVWQPVDCSYTRYSRLPVVKRVWQPCWMNRLFFNTVVKPVVQPALTTGFTTMLNEQPLYVQRTATVRSTVLNEQPLFVQPCWTNSHCSFNQLSNQVVHDRAVCQTSPVWQPVECLYTRYNQLSNRFDNGFDNRLYRVNGVLNFIG